MRCGHLLKRNRDDRKAAALVGAKYKRRFVEVTADTLLYAESQQHVHTGRIRVFAVADLVAVRAEGELKFQVRFPERSLLFKVESGGSAERDAWVAAIKAAKQQQNAAEQARASCTGATLEKLQKALLPREAQELHLSEPGSRVASSAGAAVGNSAAGTRQRLSSMSHALQLSCSGGPAQAVTQQHPDDRPLSPRLLLASARAGLALVATSSSAGSTPKAGAAAAAPGLLSPHAHKPSGGCADSESSGSEAGDLPPAALAASHSDGEALASRQHSASASAAGGGGSGPSTPGSTGARRSSQLTRRFTPGVLLTTTAPSPWPAKAASCDGGAAAQGSGGCGPGLPQLCSSAEMPAAAAEYVSSLVASCAPQGCSSTAGAAQQQQQQQQEEEDEVLTLDISEADCAGVSWVQSQRSQHGVAGGGTQPPPKVPTASSHSRSSHVSGTRVGGAGDLDDEILQLGEALNLCSTSSTSSSTSSSNSSGSTQAAARPASGSAARAGRPVTPLKSCLKGA